MLGVVDLEQVPTPESFIPNHPAPTTSQTRLPNAAVRSAVLDSLLVALGGDPVVDAVLLTASDATVATRLARREIGSALDAHFDRSQRIAPALEESAPDWVHRIETDGRAVAETAQSIRSSLDWSPLAIDL